MDFLIEKIKKTNVEKRIIPFPISVKLNTPLTCHQGPISRNLLAIMKIMRGKKSFKDSLFVITYIRVIIQLENRCLPVILFSIVPNK
jgi:hypothetical protein